MSTDEKQAAAKQTFVFPVPLANERPAQQDRKCEARVRELIYGGMKQSNPRALDRECKARVRELIYGGLKTIPERRQRS